jgi:tetratricopeptide (TPR) repeat protein
MGVHFERGQVLFEMERYREAAKEYLAELAEEPEHLPSLINLAASLFNDGNVNGAAETIEKAIGLAPEQPQSHYILCHIQLRRKNIRKAKEAVQEAIRLLPTSEYLTTLASILLHQGYKLEAADTAGTAMELDPTYVPAILFRGQMLVDAGHMDEANELFAFALRESPQEPRAQHALGRLQLAKGEAAIALDLLTEARRIDPMRSNDRSAIAAAYGLKLWPFHSINRFVARWYLWPFRLQWFLSLVLTAVFSLVSLEINLSQKRTEHELFKHTWWVIYCVLLANYLLLPYSLARVARSTAYIVAKRQFGIAWHALLLQPAGLLWIVMLHSFVTFAGFVGSGIPELVASIAAVSINYPFIAAIARSSARQLTYYLCVPALIFCSIFIVITLMVIPYDQNHAGYIFVAIYFATTYFNERLARWASSMRLF